MSNWIPPEVANAFHDALAWGGLHPVLFWGWIVCLMINNGLRLGAYRNYTDRPTWARFIVMATDPFCGNFWRLLQWVNDRAHLPFKFPSGDDASQSLPALTNATVRDAVKANEAAKQVAEKAP